jgi:hypothetical protein
VALLLPKSPNSTVKKALPRLSAPLGLQESFHRKQLGRRKNLDTDEMALPVEVKLWERAGLRSWGGKTRGVIALVLG